MPYIDGKRVSNDEWQRRYGTTKPLYTGPNGDNPAPPPELDEEGLPKQKKKAREPRSENAAKAAIANAMGVKPASLPSDIDVTGLDAPATDVVEEDAQPEAEAPAPIKADPLAKAREAKAAKKAARLAAEAE